MKHVLTLLAAGLLLFEAALALPAAAQEPDPDSTGAHIERARRLGATGGEAALPALQRLLRNREASVRTAALRAITRVALRSEKLAEMAHAIAASRKGACEERLAAITALGYLGDGDDMTLLLGLASRDTDSVEVRSAAFRAMGSISGSRLPFVHARWAYWWRMQSKRKPALLEKAFRALDDEPDAASAEVYAAAVESMAWVNLPRATDYIKNWFAGADPSLRIRACRLVGSLRLADLVGKLTPIARRHGATTLGVAAREALKTLGYVAPKEDE